MHCRNEVYTRRTTDVEISTPKSILSFFKSKLRKSKEYDCESIIKDKAMSRAKCWCFTINNWTNEEWEHLKTLEDKCAYLVAGKEIGENGTPHIQGFVKFKSKLRMEPAKRILGERAHCEVARSPVASAQYCKKDGDFFELGTFAGGSGSRSDLDEFKEDVKSGLVSLKEIREKHSEVYAKYPRFVLEYVDDHRKRPELETHPLRIWQEEINDFLNHEPDRRTIVFVVDIVGNSGKTWFAHYYAMCHERVQILTPGRKADMCYCLDTEIRVLFLDCPRSKCVDGFLQYDFLEEVKNGYIFSQKYESRIKQLGKVHVCVLMNEMPDRSKLSVDRYKILEVTRNNNVVNAQIV